MQDWFVHTTLRRYALQMDVVWKLLGLWTIAALTGLASLLVWPVMRKKPHREKTKDIGGGPNIGPPYDT